MAKALSYSDFDESAVCVMQLSNQSAWKMWHDYLDAEHILIGLCRYFRRYPSGTLGHFGVTTNELVAGLKGRVRRGPHRVERGRRSVRANAMRVTDHARWMAAALGEATVRPDHLLLGLLFVRDSPAFEALQAVRLDYESVKDHLVVISAREEIDEVIAFIAERLGRQESDLTAATTLMSLGLDGDDAEEFLLEFSEAFSVDLSGLDFSRHFGPEGLSPSFPLIWLIGTIRWLVGDSWESAVGLQPISISDLAISARAGVWRSN